MKQVLRTTGNLAFVLIVLAAFAASSLYAGEITGVESQSKGDSVVVSVLADGALEYSEAVDYAEWLLRVDFPGATLGASAQASICDFPQEVADWVRAYRLERTEAGVRLVLVLGERAVPLKIRIDREGNRLGIVIPTGDGAAEIDGEVVGEVIEDRVEKEGHGAALGMEKRVKVGRRKSSIVKGNFEEEWGSPLPNGAKSV